MTYGVFGTRWLGRRSCATCGRRLEHAPWCAEVQAILADNVERSAIARGFPRPARAGRYGDGRGTQ